MSHRLKRKRQLPRSQQKRSDVEKVEVIIGAFSRDLTEAHSTSILDLDSSRVPPPSGPSSCVVRTAGIVAGRSDGQTTQQLP